MKFTLAFTKKKKIPVLITEFSNDYPDFVYGLINSTQVFNVALGDFSNDSYNLFDAISYLIRSNTIPEPYNFSASHQIEHMFIQKKHLNIKHPVFLFGKMFLNRYPTCNIKAK